MIILYHMIAFFIGIVLDLLIGDPYRLPHPIRLIGRWIAKLDKQALPESIRSRTDGTTEVTDSHTDENVPSDPAAACASRDCAILLPQDELRNAAEERKKGRHIVLLVTITVFLICGCILVAAYLLSAYLGIAVEAVLMFYTLAAKSLKTESMKVYYALRKNDVEKARYAVSMIVGRDTDVLNTEGITKAAVETVAENASDGVIAPMLYNFIGGPVLGMTYKAINTMDSMLGYKNNRYLNLGRAAAKLDDVVNFVPARISAWMLIFGAWVLEKCSCEKIIVPIKTSSADRIFLDAKSDLNGTVQNDGSVKETIPVYDSKEAIRIFKRDRFNHKSPNSAQTESAVAGALRIELAGDAVYFGEVVSKPTIGDPVRPIEKKDIKRANKLMYAALIITGVLCLICLGIAAVLVR